MRYLQTCCSDGPGESCYEKKIARYEARTSYELLTWMFSTWSSSWCESTLILWHLHNFLITGWSYSSYCSANYQARTYDGIWFPVEPLPSAIVVNIGDAIMPPMDVVNLCLYTFVCRPAVAVNLLSCLVKIIWKDAYIIRSPICFGSSLTELTGPF